MDKELFLKEVVKTGYNLDPSVVLNKIYYITQIKDNNHHNIFVDISTQRDYYPVMRGLDIIQNLLLNAFQKEISQYINWDLEPVEYREIQDAVLYYTNGEFSTYTNNIRPRICIEETDRLSLKYNKQVALQILNLETTTSKKIKLKFIEFDNKTKINIKASMFLSINHLAYKIVYI